jgi:hypothetical protein
LYFCIWIIWEKSGYRNRNLNKTQDYRTWYLNPESTNINSEPLFAEALANAGVTNRCNPH